MRNSDKIFNEIMDTFEQFKLNAKKYRDKNIKAAAQRARKASSRLDKLFKEYRRVTVEEARDSK